MAEPYSIFKRRIKHEVQVLMHLLSDFLSILSYCFKFDKNKYYYIFSNTY